MTTIWKFEANTRLLGHTCAPRSRHTGTRHHHTSAAMRPKSGPYGWPLERVKSRLKRNDKANERRAYEGSKGAAVENARQENAKSHISEKLALAGIAVDSAAKKRGAVENNISKRLNFDHGEESRGVISVENVMTLRLGTVPFTFHSARNYVLATTKCPLPAIGEPSPFMHRC